MRSVVMPLTVHQTGGEWHGSEVGWAKLELMSLLASLFLKDADSGMDIWQRLSNDWQALCRKTKCVDM
jgi:hypothetical protein